MHKCDEAMADIVIDDQGWRIESLSHFNKLKHGDKYRGVSFPDREHTESRLKELAKEERKAKAAFKKERAL